MADPAESGRGSLPLTTMHSPPLAIPEDSSSEAILWADCDAWTSGTPHTDLLSPELSAYCSPLIFHTDADEDVILEEVPTLQDIDFECSVADLQLYDWFPIMSSIAMQAPDVTQPLGVPLHAPAVGEEEDDLSRLALALGIRAPKASVFALALRIQFQLPFATAAATMPVPPPPPANFESQSVENITANCNSRAVAPWGNPERLQTGQSSRPSRQRSPRKKKLAVNGKMRAPFGTSTDPKNVNARYQRKETNKRLKILQGLVPGADKADMVSLLEKTCSYIKSMEQQILKIATE